MRPRLLTCALALAVLPAVSPAHAACRLIEDPRGDTRPVASDQYDIVRADIALGKSEFVAVLALADLGDRGPADLGGGGEWALSANGSGTRYEFSVRRELGPNPRYLWQARVGDVILNSRQFTGTIAGNTLSWRIPRKGIAALNRSKLFWSAATASTTDFVGPADEAHDHGRCRKV